MAWVLKTRKSLWLSALQIGLYHMIDVTILMGYSEVSLVTCSNEPWTLNLVHQPWKCIRTKESVTKENWEFNSHSWSRLVWDTNMAAGCIIILGNQYMAAITSCENNLWVQNTAMLIQWTVVPKRLCTKLRYRVKTTSISLMDSVSAFGCLL